MYQGMSQAVEMVRVERELMDQSLKYHYVLADERVRCRRPSRLAAIGSSLRTLFNTHPHLRQERCS